MYNSFSFTIRPCKKKFFFYIISYLAALIGLMWPSYTLSQDTLEQDTVKDSIIAVSLFETEKQEQQWIQQIRKVENELDSIKAHYHHRNDISIDTSGIDRALARLFSMDQEVSHLKVQTAESRKKVQVFRADSTINNHDAQRRPNARIRMQQDSMVMVDSLLEKLSLDIGMLSSDLRQLKGNQLLIEADTTLHSPDSIARTNIVSRLRHNMELDRSLSDYFDLDAWGGRILLILISLGYFYFLHRQGRKAKTADKENVPLYQNEPVWIPILKTLVFFGMLLPLFSFRIPVFVIQIVYLCLFMVLYVLLYRRYSEEKKWVIFVWAFVYAFLIIANLILSADAWPRILAATGNLAALFLVWSLLIRNKRNVPFHYMPRYVLILISIGFAVALIANATGYLILARIFSTASAVGFIQGLVLSASTKMIMHDVTRYYDEASEEKAIRRFDVAHLTRSLARLLAIVNVMIVLAVLINTLGIADTILNGLERIFLKTRSIGGITYSYANLIFAIVALLVANWLQKTLNRIFNPPASEDRDMKKYALFPLFRLLIVVIGLLIAIGILGVGVTQLTVVVGALSVGIGLGLQNIINNFVSGIILIFEKPFKIGDYIELADRRGRVSQIGIRSSVLISDQGGKVIIPNGDLLSGRIVNWTLYDTQIRFGMELVVGNTVPIKEIKDKLLEMLKSDRFVEQAAPIHVYTKSIQADTYTVSLHVVLKHVRHMERFRGTFLEKVKNEMDTKEVKITSS